MRSKFLIGWTLFCLMFVGCSCSLEISSQPSNREIQRRVKELKQEEKPVEVEKE